jgi:hypothetical protein
LLLSFPQLLLQQLHLGLRFAQLLSGCSRSGSALLAQSRDLLLKLLALLRVGGLPPLSLRRRRTCGSGRTLRRRGRSGSRTATLLCLPLRLSSRGRLLHSNPQLQAQLRLSFSCRCRCRRLRRRHRLDLSQQRPRRVARAALQRLRRPFRLSQPLLQVASLSPQLRLPIRPVCN